MEFELNHETALKGAVGTTLVLGFVAFKQYRKARRMQKLAVKMTETAVMFGRANMEFADDLENREKDPEQALADWQTKMEFLSITLNI